MLPIKIMLNGLPGNVTSIIAKCSLKDQRVELLPYSLTGPEITESFCDIGTNRISLVQPDEKETVIEKIKNQFGNFISVDFTHPSAVNHNAAFYAENGLHFVMGTTGGDRQALERTVADSQICAVIAPNMAKQIVGFQAMMEYAAQTFPNLFKGYSLKIKESHQQGKADTSGTAKAMVTYFNKMGIPFSGDQIEMERDPKAQEQAWGIPRDYLKGHAWHTYTLLSPDGSTRFEFSHNVNGREIYAGGAFDAVVFLADKIKAGKKGAVFSMIDVLKG
jgi:4-hydroxy-tetrahydrodipicolinate reductase